MAEENLPGPRETIERSAPIIIEETFNVPVVRVWEAISDNRKMREWYFDIMEFRPVVGFEFEFEGGTKAKKYLHLCKVVEVVAFKKLKYSWRYEGYEGISYVTFELFNEGNKTRLKLTHDGVGSFPSSNPDLARENFVEGWSSIVGSSLRKFLGSDH